jgi:hypothetical protein
MLSNGTYAHNLPFDKLNSVILGEDSSLSHLVVFVNGEEPPLKLQSHCRPTFHFDFSD